MLTIVELDVKAELVIQTHPPLLLWFNPYQAIVIPHVKLECAAVNGVIVVPDLPIVEAVTEMQENQLMTVDILEPYQPEPLLLSWSVLSLVSSL